MKTCSLAAGNQAQGKNNRICRNWAKAAYKSYHLVFLLSDRYKFSYMKKIVENFANFLFKNFI
jgi:hypothetical protein